MKVTVEDENLRCTVENTDDCGSKFINVIELFRYASLGVGFGQKTIDEFTVGP